MERGDLNLTPEVNDKLDSESLRAEITSLREEELVKKERGESYISHFVDANPSELTEEDLEIYGKFKNQNLTQEEFDEQKGKAKNGRKGFFAWISNQLMDKKNMKWFDPETYQALFGIENKE